MRPSSGVGNGPGRMLHRWIRDEAVCLALRIDATVTIYPRRDRFRLFPAPDSNTYVQWILGSSDRLGWKGCGRRDARFRWR